jgi:RNA polymerase sigma-70 factor (ECF subfamily)
MTIELLNQEFEGIVGHLRSYLLRITASVVDAEDIAQDTYIKAAEKINTFRGESSLKTWVFTIASNLAKDNLRAQKRWVENVTDITKAAALNNQQFFKEAMQIRMTSPNG